MRKLMTIIAVLLPVAAAIAQEKDPQLEADYAQRIFRAGVNYFN